MGAVARAGVAEPLQRLRLEVSGAVQGVGFRPFVHRLATEEGLCGFVRNTAAGATVEVEGPAPAIERFLRRLDAELPPPAHIEARAARALTATGRVGFVIEASESVGSASAHTLPDLVTCADCLAEIFDPANRRHLHPFTTCTHCGPRYSIVEALPYDRARTAMADFAMCPACAAEYADPASRRFHAETNACPDCGPRLSLLDADGAPGAGGADVLAQVAEAIRAGSIVALKGVGGFQLLCDARNDGAVSRLRQRKHRPAKPFAVMVASLDAAQGIADLEPAEAEMLASAAGPIVLVRARPANGIAGSVAPGNPLLGIMLPTTPLHHILMRELGVPIVATSGNRSGEPIATTDEEAMAQLTGIADLFLTNDRRIVRPVDDSVVRVIAGTPTTLRHARGLAALVLKAPVASTGLALGAHQKNAIAVWRPGEIVLGPHIGDLDTVETRAAFTRAVGDFPRLSGIMPDAIAADLHPDYFSTATARRMGPSVVGVPHHAAHVFAAMAEHGLEGEVLGISWDGTGLGTDGTAWGGEVLAIEGTRIRRVAHLLPFMLPGGDATAREPRRSALGVLHALGDRRPLPEFTAGEQTVLTTALDRGLNAPLTTSAGRLFDAVASLLGLCQIASFEGEAGMAVEIAADGGRTDIALAPVDLIGADPIVLDWRPTLRDLLRALDAGVSPQDLAAAFHAALAEAIVAVACVVGVPRIVLTGGCFQNARLAGLVDAALAWAGFAVYRHGRVPPNDGGLAAGQALYAARLRAEETD